MAHDADMTSGNLLKEKVICNYGDIYDTNDETCDDNTFNKSNCLAYNSTGTAADCQLCDNTSWMDSNKCCPLG